MIKRRRIRSRVLVLRETCETAGDMRANLAGQQVAKRRNGFPYANWGPGAAILGVIVALGVGVMLGVPALVLGGQHGEVEEFEPPLFERAPSFDDRDSSDIANGIRGVSYSDHETEIAAFDDHGNELAGSPFGSFEDSHGVTANRRSGRVYVSDEGDASVSVFESRRGSRPPRLVAELAAGDLPAALAGDFKPERLAADFSQRGGGARGDVYVIDRDNDTVLRLAAGGAYRGEIDGAAVPDGSFEFDESEDGNAIAVDPSRRSTAGDVYVLASHEGGDSGSVWAFGPSGAYLWELRANEDQDFCGVAVDQEGGIWIADAGGGVTRYVPARQVRKPPTPTATKLDTRSNSCPTSVGDEGDLYVAHAADHTLTTTANIFVQLSTALGFLLVPMALASMRGASGWREIFARLGVRRFRLSAAKWMAAAVGAYLLFAYLYSTLVVVPHQKDIAEGFGPVPIQVLLIVLAAPISEEVCFRGMLFGGLRTRLPRIAAALLCGLIFGGLHALTGVTAVPPLIAFGFILALLYEKTGSVVPGILLHMLNNSVALLGQ
jgi:membrane protease YdiL (CAAX protease family)